MDGFIAKHRAVWPVAWVCDALSISRRDESETRNVSKL